ncbi:MAG: DmsC/YnfH family molybdoenzyme membrane anchor subunit [Geminicoccaceae bacterium]
MRRPEQATVCSPGSIACSAPDAMRPAYSVILFTVLSGAGYGLAAMAALMLASKAMIALPRLAVVSGLALASCGLVASTFHLGRPERAWRALSQWRTSWLSREAVLALATFVVTIPLIVLLDLERNGGLAIRLAAAAMAVSCLATVLCTAMIYASLRPVRQWRHWTVPAAYLFYALGSGGVLLNLLQAAARAPSSMWSLAPVPALLVAWGVREANWWLLHARPGQLSIADATGLARLGTVRALDPPHTESNYLLHEFGFRVARRHIDRLRALARALGLLLPVVATLLVAGPEPLLPNSLPVTSLAAVAVLAGLLVERWLFFAQARHTTALYYGAPAA